MLRQVPVPPLSPPSLPRAARGYQRKATEEFIEELSSHYESVWLERKRLHDEVARLEAAVREQAALKQEVERLERTLAQQAKKQQLVTGALYSAERFAETIKEDARRDAELALRKARERAEEIVGEAHKTRARLDHETRRLESITTQMRSDLMATLASVLDDLEADVSADGSPNGASTPRSTQHTPEYGQTAGS